MLKFHLHEKKKQKQILTLLQIKHYVHDNLNVSFIYLSIEYGYIANSKYKYKVELSVEMCAKHGQLSPTRMGIGHWGPEGPTEVEESFIACVDVAKSRVTNVTNLGFHFSKNNRATQKSQKY